MEMDIFSEFFAAFAEDAEFMGQFMLTYLGSMLMSSLLSIAAYVLQSLGFYSIAKRRGIHHPWLAWIPVGNMWILGSISDQYQYVAKGKVKNRRKTLLGLQIAMTATGILIVAVAVAFVFTRGLEMMPGDTSTPMSIGLALLLLAAYLVLLVVTILLTVFQYIACYDLYVSCNPDNAVIFLVLSIFISITMPIFIFVVRNKDGGMPPRRVQPPTPELGPDFAQPEDFNE